MICDRKRPNLESAKCTKVVQREHGPDEPKNPPKKPPKIPRWRRFTAEMAPCQKHMVQPWFEPGTSPSLGGGTPPKTSTSQIAGKKWLTPPNIVGVRKWRNANAVPMSQKNAENSLVAPSYGRNGSGGGGLWAGRIPPGSGCSGSLQGKEHGTPGGLGNESHNT